MKQVKQFFYDLSAKLHILNGFWQRISKTIYAKVKMQADIYIYCMQQFAELKGDEKLHKHMLE